MFRNRGKATLEFWLVNDTSFTFCRPSDLFVDKTNIVWVKAAVTRQKRGWTAIYCISTTKRWFN